MSPTPTDLYVPVVDISEHQGIVDFGTMRDRGVQGLIIRTNHALAVDKRCVRYVLDARAAGWRDDQIGFYTFCNPKRATGADSGKAFVDTVRKVFGRTDTLLMLDIEGYESQPGGNLPVLKGPAFAAWIREHIATVVDLAPDCRLIAYSNASFWNPWVGDQGLADSLEWIVPRYPVYSAAGYAANPVPAVGAWVGWAWRAGPKGPIPPSGATWAGWQFSAGYNRQGPVYGCQSSDLDLNVVEASAWARWTNTTPAPIPVPIPVPVPPSTDIEDTEEITVRIKVNDGPRNPDGTVVDKNAAPNVWFERVGMDLHSASSGNLFAKMPGAKADESDIAWLTTDEMTREVNAIRYTYGPVKAEMGPAFVAAWEAKREPVPGGGGGGGPITIPALSLTGVITPVR